MKKPIILAGISLAFLPVLPAQEFPREVAPIAGIAPAPRLPSPPTVANVDRTAVYYNGGNTLITSSSGGVPPIVVRFSGGQDDANPALEEDLNVMSRLIERSLEHGLGDDGPDVKMGIRMLMSDGGRSVRATYLEGFGALFMIKVGFPVLPPNLSEPKDAAAPAPDTEWEKAKRDVYGGPENRFFEPGTGGGAKFDPEQVEELKSVLMQNLKNAANIRNLKPNDYVAITVFGHSAAVGPLKKSRRTSSTSGQPGTSAARPEGQDSTKGAPRAEEKATATVAAVARQTDSLRTPGQGTVLTIRVKKSDVDAFAKGQMDLEAFQKKAEQHSYTGSGYGVSSINSWSKGSGGGGGGAGMILR